jgi:hypothetical protein
VNVISGDAQVDANRSVAPMDLRRLHEQGSTLAQVEREYLTRDVLRRHRRAERLLRQAWALFDQAMSTLDPVIVSDAYEALVQALCAIAKALAGRTRLHYARWGWLCSFGVHRQGHLLLIRDSLEMVRLWVRVTFPSRGRRPSETVPLEPPHLWAPSAQPDCAIAPPRLFAAPPSWAPVDRLAA